MNHPFLMCHDICDTSYRLGSTDCIRDMSWYDNLIKVNSNR